MPYKEIPYGGSYKGLNVQTPAIYLDPAETPSVQNFWFRNNQLQSPPPFVKVFNGPDGMNPSLGQISFKDSNEAWHTCSFTTRGLWQLVPYNVNASNPQWVYVGSANIQASQPVAASPFANLLYFTNGTQNMYSWDGLSDAPVNVTNLTSSFGGSSGSPSTIGGNYLYTINDQLCLLNVTLYYGGVDGSIPAGTITNFPQRIWWSANGVPNQWDPAVNTSAGFNDFLDCPDYLTGVIAIGEIAYIFRNNGITQQTITGNALAPFYFDHMWASQQGIGNVYPWSIAQYGSIGMFISTENVYTMSVNSFEPCGGGARDAIMADLAASVINPVSAIIPNFNYGYIYLTYWICIPIQGGTRFYIYSIEDKNWTSGFAPNQWVTGIPSVCWR